MINIDGSAGEGGGQILRTSLGLSLITGKPFRIEKIRAGRKSPGLLRQHLTAVNAAAKIGNAEVTGASIGSQALTFKPGNINPGEYKFSIGTAGSTTLVLQTVLPPLMLASSPSSISFEGGTHNPFAPPFDFLSKAFLPLVAKIGPQVTVELIRSGFYPAGGGEIRVRIEPAKSLNRVELVSRGKIKRAEGYALVAKLPDKIAERELAIIKNRLGWESSALHIRRDDTALSPGNVVSIEIEHENVVEVFTGFGEKGIRAEAVAEQAVKEAEAYLNSDAIVGEHLADQLLLPMALAGGGSYITLPLSLHSTTNIGTIKKFMDIDIEVSQIRDKLFKISLNS
jgi:RNA 3'-terminal phosphate cyclase (ATP)